MNKSIPRISSLLVIIISAVVLIGWIINNEILKRIIPTLVQMNPYSAIFFIVFAFLLIWQTFPVSNKMRILRSFIPLPIIIFGGVMLLKYMFQIDAHIDQTLFTSTLEGNRMAPNTTICFLLLGIILFFLGSKKKVITISLQIAIAFVLLVTLQAIVGYLYNLTNLYQINNFIPMAIHTAFCFTVLCIGIMASQKDFAITKYLTRVFQESSVNRKINTALLLGLLVLVSVGIISYIDTRNFIDDSHLVENKISQQVIRTKFLTYMIDAETGQRGFIITGQESYLQPYDLALLNYPQTLQKLKNIDSDPVDRKLISQMSDFTQKKFDELALTLQVRRSRGFVAAQKIVNSNTGKAYADSIRRIIEQLDNNDSQKLAILTNEENQSAQRIITTLFLGSLFASFIVIMALFLINSDLKKRKEIVDKLAESEAKDQAILGSIGDGVFAIDKNENIIMFNHAAEQASGYKVAEVIGKPYKSVLQFIHELNGTPVDEFIHIALSGKKAEMAELTLLKNKDGSTIPVADSAAPIFNSEGVVDGSVIVFRNIAKERDLEKLKDEFLSVASHELRTPMTAIRGLVSMIVEGDYGNFNENLKEPLSNIEVSTHRLINLVNDLLNVSRIEAGRTKFKLSEFSLDTIIKQVIGTLQPLTKQKGIELKSEYIPPFSVQGDTDKIQEIFNNIFGNAIKFTDSGSITVAAKEDGDLVIIYITDSGIGISSDNQKKLFGKFEQVSSEKDGRPQGTGLGLFISRELARTMGGDLWIERSEVGKGTTFGFSVPFANSQKATTIKRAMLSEAQMHPDQK